MMVVVDVEVAEALKLKKSELIPVGLNISAANNSRMVLLGAALMKISGRAKDGTLRSSKQLVYVSEGVSLVSSSARESARTWE